MTVKLDALHSDQLLLNWRLNDADSRFLDRCSEYEVEQRRLTASHNSKMQRVLIEKESVCAQLEESHLDSNALAVRLCNAEADNQRNQKEIERLTVELKASWTQHESEATEAKNRFDILSKTNEYLAALQVSTAECRSEYSQQLRAIRFEYEQKYAQCMKETALVIQRKETEIDHVNEQRFETQKRNKELNGENFALSTKYNEARQIARYLQRQFGDLDASAGMYKGNETEMLLHGADEKRYTVNVSVESDALRVGRRKFSFDEIHSSFPGDTTFFWEKPAERCCLTIITASGNILLEASCRYARDKLKRDIDRMLKGRVELKNVVLHKAQFDWSEDDGEAQASDY